MKDLPLIFKPISLLSLDLSLNPNILNKFNFGFTLRFLLNSPFTPSGFTETEARSLNEALPYIKESK